MTELLTPKDVATVFKVKPQQVLRWARAGKLPATQFNRLWRFRADEIEEVSRTGLKPPSDQMYIQHNKARRPGGRARVWQETPAT
jgi:excisionase family DNA binding protein